jgi:hypothetical protein
MGITIPTTKQIAEQFLANLESKLNQTSPLSDKAFLRVLSANEGSIFTVLYKFGLHGILQNLVLTATGEDLDSIGNNYGVFRRAATPFKGEGQIEIEAGSPKTMNAGTVFVGDSNNLRYLSTETITGQGASYSFDLQAEESGEASNLVINDTMTISTPISGIDTVANITAVWENGIDREDDDSYRRRVLTEIRTVGGGGNSADYRTWSEQVIGVARAFPWSGSPDQGVIGFEDGDCEDPGTSAWLATGSTVLSKTTSSPYSGVRALRVAYGGTANPSAAQTVLVPGREYRVHGWARGDGSKPPYIQQGPYTIWQGITSTAWQEFEAVFIANTSTIYFYAKTSVSGYCDFDDITLEYRSDEVGIRTVFIEAIESIDVDGIAPQSLLDDVRDSINIDPETGLSRPPLGCTDESLYVESIVRTSIYVTIRGLVVSSEQEAAAKDKIQLSIDEYLRSMSPFIVGLDVDLDRNDTISELSLSTIVQDILRPVGGYAASVGFGLIPGEFYSTYTLFKNELAKLASPGGIIYV